MPKDAAVDGSVNAVAERIQARRQAGMAPKPEGPPPEGMSDDDGKEYKPRQNLHTDDEKPEETGKVSHEQLLKEALGLDNGDQDENQETAEAGEDALEADAAEDEPTDADNSDAEEVELNFQSVEELADIVGMGVDDLLSKVKVSTMVDGELGEISLADLKKGHQLESSFTRKNQAFVQQRKAFEQEQEAKRAQIADHFTKATTAFNLAQQQLYADFQGVDWNRLQTENPQEWTMKRQQFGERQARLDQAMRQTTQQLQQAQVQQKKAAEDARERHLDEQHDLLMAAVPTWKKDPQRAQSEGTQIATYLSKIGFTPEEIENCEDHRLILLGRAALGLDGPSKQKRDLAKKKVAEVQNLVKPGNGQKRRTQGNAAFVKKAQAAKQTLAKTGTTDAAAAAILARRQARQASAKRNRRSRV